MRRSVGVLLMMLASASVPRAQTTTSAGEQESIEPRLIGTSGTTMLGFSGYADKFFSADATLPVNYTLQIDVGRFLTERWVARAGLVGSGSYGGDDGEDLPTGSGAPAVHAMGGLFFYFTPRSIWSAYAGVEYGAQLTQRAGATRGSLIGDLGLQGAVSSRTSLFVEGGFGRGLNRDDEGNQLSRFVGRIGIRLKL